MSLWSKLTGGGKKPSEAELSAEADAFLQEIEQQIVVDTKKAMKRIMNRPKRLEPAFDFGGPFHERFADVVLNGTFLKKRNEGAVQRARKDLPSNKIVTDLEAATVAEASSAATAAETDVIFLRFVKEWPPDVLAALEALYELVIDPSALFIIHGGPDNVFIRREHFLTAARSLDLAKPLNKSAEELFLLGEAQEGIDYDDNVVSAYGYAFCKFFRKTR